MDENKLNPSPIDEPEEQQKEVAQDSVEDFNESVAEEADVETVETAETCEAEQSEDGDCPEVNEISEEAEDASDETEALEEQELTSEVKPKKKKSKGAIAALVVLVLLLIAAAGSLIYVVVSSATSKIDYDEIAVTIGDVDITVGEYMYWYTYVDAYYYNYYSYYYSQISEDQIKADTLNQMTYISALYSDAVKAGYTLTAEDSTQIDSNMDAYKEAAEASSMEVDEYIAGNFGKGYTAEMLRSYLEKQAVAYRYYEEKMAEIDSQFEGSDIAEKVEAEYLENKKDYDISDVSYWYFDSTDDSAVANAEKIIEAVNNGTDFDEAIKSATGDSAAISNKLKGYDSMTISGNFAEEAAEWIFAQDEESNYVNITGAVTQIEAGGVIYVLYANEEPHRDESIPVTVDYIRVDISEDAALKTEDELNLQAKSTANSILKEFEEGDKSADSFMQLVEKYNNSENVLVSGDVFEDMKNDDSHDEAVENWAFDESRKIGDYGVVEGDDCYFILFYREQAENPVWYQSVYTALVQNTKSDWETNLMSNYEDSVVTNDEAINGAVAFVKENLVA